MDNKMNAPPVLKFSLTKDNWEDFYTWMKQFNSCVEDCCQTDPDRKLKTKAVETFMAGLMDQEWRD